MVVLVVFTKDQPANPGGSGGGAGTKVVELHQEIPPNFGLSMLVEQWWKVVGYSRKSTIMVAGGGGAGGAGRWF